MICAMLLRNYSRFGLGTHFEDLGFVDTVLVECKGLPQARVIDNEKAECVCEINHHLVAFYQAGCSSTALTLHCLHSHTVM